MPKIYSTNKREWIYLSLSVHNLTCEFPIPPTVRNSFWGNLSTHMIDETVVASDELLIARLKEGDHAAFELLFGRYARQVYRQAMRMLANPAEAEEVMQEVFLAVYTKCHTFRGDAAFSTWLYRLTANAAITRLRQHQRHPETELDEYLPQFGADGHHKVRPVIDWSQQLEKRLADAEMRQVIEAALNLLSPIDKAVVVLSDLEGLPNQEIAEILELTLSAVKSRLHRARLFLRGKLALYFGHSPT